MTTPRTFCSFLGLLLVASRAFAVDIPNYPFVFVVGKADVDTPPNIATCSLTLRSRDQDPAKAASIVEERLKAVLGILGDNRIAAKDIESFNVQKQVLTNDEESGDKGTATIRGYDVWRNVKVTVRQLQSLPPVEMSLLKAPNVANIDCQFDRTDRATLESDLLTKALQSARDEADKLAGPLGRHVNSAVAISRVPFDSIPGSFGLGGGYAEKFDRMFKRSTDYAADLRGDELLVPATIHMSISVNVLFKTE